MQIHSNLGCTTRFTEPKDNTVFAVKKKAEQIPGRKGDSAGRVTLREIAKRVGVSHVTVSLALRNHPSISSRRRSEIKRMAKRMGYRPDPALSSLIAYRFNKKSARIQHALVWVNRWQHPEELRRYGEFNSYWRGASNSAEQFGYHLDEVRWGKNLSASRFHKILDTRKVQGLLIPPHAKLPDWEDFDWSRYSVIRFGMSVPQPASNLVSSDQFRFVVLAARRIYEHGYRRIGFVIQEELDLNAGGSHFGAFCWAQDQLHLRPAIPPLRIFPQARSAADQQALFRKDLSTWLKRYRPDAILTSHRFVPETIEDLGYRIPEDIAVAGTSITDIPVDAGIDQRGTAIGQIAVEMLVGLINANERGLPATPRRVLIEGKWRDGSSLPPRRKGRKQ